MCVLRCKWLKKIYKIANYLFGPSFGHLSYRCLKIHDRVSINYSWNMWKIKKLYTNTFSKYMYLKSWLLGPGHLWINSVSNQTVSWFYMQVLVHWILPPYILLPNLKNLIQVTKYISFTKSLFYKRESHVCKDKRRLSG